MAEERGQYESGWPSLRSKAWAHRSAELRRWPPFPFTDAADRSPNALFDDVPEWLLDVYVQALDVEARYPYSRDSITPPGQRSEDEALEAAYDDLKPPGWDDELAQRINQSIAESSARLDAAAEAEGWSSDITLETPGATAEQQDEIDADLLGLTLEQLYEAREIEEDQDRWARRDGGWSIPVEG